MADHGIQPAVWQPPYEVQPDATMAEVARYTDWYIAGRGDTQPHYRFNRYYYVIKYTASSVNYRVNYSSRVVHIDIGCGPGLFAWALLDWARENHIEYSRIDLYGYDQSKQMVELARQMRDRLRVEVGDYPMLYYHYDLDSLLENLEVRYDRGADCIVTLGHVLAGNQESSDLDEYTRIVDQIVKLQNPSKQTTVLVSDATSGKHLVSSM